MQGSNSAPRVAFTLAIIGWSGACSAVNAPKSPEAVVAAHVGALAAGDRAQASLWLSRDGLQRAKPWPPASKVPRGEVIEVQRTAQWRLKTGRQLRVQRGPSGWRIDGGVLGLDRAATPAEALRVLARVILSSDYAGLLQLLPQQERAFWTAERLGRHLAPDLRSARWTTLAKQLQAPPTGGWPQTWRVPGERVEVRVPPPKQGQGESAGAPMTLVVLGRELGAWKVLDVLPHHHYTPPR